MPDLTTKETSMTRTYHPDAVDETWSTPTVPYSLIDAINRAAAATGSPRYAAAASGADYNGHRVHVDTGARAGWRAHYTWAGLRWITRGNSFEGALAVALVHPSALAKGGRVVVQFSSYADTADLCPTDERRAHLRDCGLLPEAEAKAVDATWQDWRYDEAHSALDWDRRFGGGAVAALLSMTPDQTKDDYFEARRTRKAIAKNDEAGKNAHDLLQGAGPEGEAFEALA